MKTIADLVDRQAPGLTLVKKWLREATHPADLLPASGEGEDVLVALQVTTRVPLGAVAYDSGGLLVDGGWLRVLGSGHARLTRSLSSWNRIGSETPRLEGALLVGDDVVGGFFAWNGGAFPSQIPNTVWYLSPDTLQWEDTGLGYSDWLVWALTGDLTSFYEGLRWDGWEEEVALLSGDQAFSVLPFISTEGPAISERVRRAIPIGEIWDLHATTLPRQQGLPFIEG